MIDSFSFSRLPLILFGNGKVKEIPHLVRSIGSSLMLVTGRSSFTGSQNGQELMDSFSAKGIKYHHIIIGAEPTPEMIDSAVASASNDAPDVIVAVGGGSVIDAGKAISAMIPLQEPVMDYLEGVGNREHPGRKIPFIAVPTTSGTGSEATKNAVISKTGPEGFKRSLRHDNFVPDYAVVDPGLTLYCPPEITAASGMDCFTQLLEAFLSTKANRYTDALAMEGIKAVKASLVRCFSDGSDTGGREGMSFAALTSGICLANAGLGAIHGFASSVGGRYDIPHGLICGTLMAASNDIIVRELRKGRGDRAALEKYVSLGRLFSEEAGRSDDFYIDGFIAYLHKLTSELKLPGLKKAGVREEDLKSLALQTENKNNPVKLTADELFEILSLRYHD